MLMNKKMELLRETINDMMILETYDDMELLNKSREMDLLILQSIKKSNFVRLTLGYEYMNEFDIIIDKLQLFEKIYQSMRIVDPVSKRALELNESELGEMEVICENCASIREYNKCDTTFRMENNGNKSYMVVAIPMSIQKKQIVVELFKDATTHLQLGDEKLGDEVKTLSTIEYIDQAGANDEFTNLYNRRYINEKLPVDLLKSSLRNEPLSVIFVDLHFFKTFNDKYGQLEGEQVLREFVEELKVHIHNKKGWVARYAAEEFMICLSNTDNSVARSIVKSIKKSVMQKEFNIRDERIQLTCSFGVHTVCNENECLTSDDLDDIIELADRRVYQTKAGGRSRIFKI